MRSLHRDTLVHVLFLTGLLAAYLGVLFAVADLSDAGNALHDATRMLAATLELAFAGLVMAWPLRLWRQRRRLAWFVVYMLIAIGVLVVYLIQVYSLYLSNNFVSVLGLQNVHDTGLTRSSLEAVIFGAGAVWLILLGVFTWRQRPQRNRHGYRLLTCLVVAGVLYAWLFMLQRQHVRLEPDFRQVPLASMVVNASIALRGVNETLPAASASSTAIADSPCFRDPAAGKVAGFPFQKPLVYQQPPPFPRKSNAIRHPNVIVIFTEGLSARMVGAYGGKYPGLTPHIDRLAQRAMKVTDYYNHTAATYRGLIGQNTSGYAFRGGGRVHGWLNAGKAGGLAAIRRSSVADILAAHGYGTVFFTADRSAGGPFARMLHAIGFRQVYGVDRISKLLGGRDVLDVVTGQTNDRSLFAGLVVWLRRRHAQGSRQPFYLGTYNMGTHAFIPMELGGDRYAPDANRFLNKLHNYDAALGHFLSYFFASPWANNTILVFTADHATYPDKTFREVAGKDLKPYFVDRIPLIIYDPTHRLPATFDAHARNSLALAPTVLQLLGVRDAPNSFLGASLFEPRRFPVGVSALGNDFYVTTPNGVTPLWGAPGKVRAAAECERGIITRYYRLELTNGLFTGVSGSSRPTLASAASIPASLQPHHPPPVGRSLCAMDRLDGRTFTHRHGDVPMPAGPTFSISGWMVDARHRATTGLDIVLQPVDGGTASRFPGTTGIVRPDVMRVLGSEAALRSGFNVMGDTATLAPGRYRILAQAGTGASAATCNFHVTLRVGRGGNP